MRLVPILLYALMGGAMHFSHGHYKRLAGPYTLFFFFACFSMFTFDHWKLEKPRTVKLFLTAALIYFLWMVYDDPVVIYAANGPAMNYFHWLISGSWVLSIILFLLLTKENIQRKALLTFRGASVVAQILLIAALAMVPVISPKPFIDVWVNNQQAVDFFLQGMNPYSQPYMDIYQGKYDYHAGFLYFPGILYWLAPFRAFFGDIRYGFIFANALSAIGLMSLAKRLNIAESIRWLIVLLWLAFPVTFFVLEQAWIDTLLVSLAILALWSAECRRWVLAGLLGGLAFAMKQYGFLITGIVLFRIFRLAGWKPALRATAASTGIFLAAIVPFAIADWPAFYESTLGGHADAGVRLDAFNFTVFLALEAKTLLPGAARMILGGLGPLISAVWMLRKPEPRLSDAAAALTLSYGTAFLFGKWAFCNYHYLLAGFVLLFLLTSFGERSATASAQGA